MQSKTFTGASKADAQQKADAWWNTQHGVKKLEWKFAVSDQWPIPDDQKWTSTIVYEQEAS